MICNSGMAFSFYKEFNCLDLEKIDYYTCTNCGFTLSKQHLEMSKEQWAELNSKYHSYHKTNKTTDDINWIPRLTSQSKMLTELYNIIPHNKPWIDYGCGDGKLSVMLNKNNIKINCFDIVPCSKDIEYLKSEDLKDKGFDLVVTTSVFEHFRSYDELNAVEKLVSDTGAMAIHTLISNKIPKDPGWFYLLPVHCALYTNKSMKILFDRWGYKFSLYCCEARMWVMFKQPQKYIQNILDTFAYKYDYKYDFVDYWK